MLVGDDCQIKILYRNGTRGASMVRVKQAKTAMPSYKQIPILTWQRTWKSIIFWALTIGGMWLVGVYAKLPDLGQLLPYLVMLAVLYEIIVKIPYVLYVRMTGRVLFIFTGGTQIILLKDLSDELIEYKGTSYIGPWRSFLILIAIVFLFLMFVVGPSANFYAHYVIRVQ